MVEDFDFEVSVKDALREAFKERGNVNILIAGATGVGKSTLINAIFQGKMADTGQGRSVTPNTREIKKDGIPLSIFDTRGLEMADFDTTMNELRALVSERSRDSDPRKHIHVAWICILEDSRRVQPAEEELCRMLADHMPVVAVITKIRSVKSDQGFRAEVQKLLPLAENVVRIRALPEEDDDESIKPVLGLKELVDLTMGLVPEGQKRAFVAAQKIDIALKKTQSHIIVVGAAASAAGVAALPIPFSDAVGIVPIQIGMLAGISATFGLSIDESFLSTVVGSVVVGAGGTLAGRTIVSALLRTCLKSQLKALTHKALNEIKPFRSKSSLGKDSKILFKQVLKLIPGVGSVLGGTIAATTAAALTTAFGEAYMAALEMLFLQNKGEPPTPKEVVDAFKQKYSQLAVVN